MDNKNLIDLSEYKMSEAELFSTYDHTAMESEKITAPRYSYWRSVIRVFFKKKSNYFFIGLLIVVLLFAYIYPSMVHYDQFAHISDDTSKHLTAAKAIEKYGLFTKSATSTETQEPGISYVLGTGASGQPTFDAMWNGARISISLSLICAAISMTIGVLVGAVWGFSRKIDLFMTEVYNIIGNVPYLILTAVLVLLFSPSFWTMVFAMTVTEWIYIAYFIRTQVIIIRDREYNLASKCLGTSTVRIAMRNILPFMVSVIVTELAAIIPAFIGSEVYLAYLGMGLSEASLGKIISEAQSAMVTPGWGFEFWSPVILSAIIAIVLYVAGQNIGDASDPRTHM